MAVHTLERMAGGGTYGHVEGGFFRYSTTQDWSVPHFEKMLEDHAGLVDALALAGLRTELDETTGYLDRILRDPATGLYAGSQDADEHYYSLDAAARARETAPYVDRRIYTSWTAALAISYLDAALPCDRPPPRDHPARLLKMRFPNPTPPAPRPPRDRLMAARFAAAPDRTPEVVKVRAGHAELARGAVLAHPYVVLDRNGDARAVVCVGTICLAPVATQAAIGDAIQEARQARA